MCIYIYMYIQGLGCRLRIENTLKLLRYVCIEIYICIPLGLGCRSKTENKIETAESFRDVGTP